MITFIGKIRPGEPICSQIIEAAKKAVPDGSLKIGDRFPSVRELSEHLKISPTTVHKAVQALKESGHLSKDHGIGMKVTVPAEDRMKLLKPRFIELATAAHRLELKIDHMLKALEIEAESVYSAKAREPGQRPWKPV